MTKSIKLFSTENITMLSSWTEELYCSFEENGTILIEEHKFGDGADQWFYTSVDSSVPSDFINAVNGLENIDPPCINTIISKLKNIKKEFARELELYIENEK